MCARTLARQPSRFLLGKESHCKGLDPVLDGQNRAFANYSLWQKFTIRQMFLQKEHRHHYIPKENQVWRCFNLLVLAAQG